MVIPRPRGASYVLPAMFIVATLLILGLVGLLARFGGSSGGPPPPIVPLPVQQIAVEARGKVVPIAWANLSTSVPGRISAIITTVGAQVGPRQELLRVETAEGSVSILYPYRAEVAYISARV